MIRTIEEKIMKRVALEKEREEREHRKAGDR